MGHSTILISLSLVTLLCGLSIAAYQLWSAENARQDGRQSALAARYGKAPIAARPPEPTPPTRQDEPRIPPATLHAEADVIAVPPPQAARQDADRPEAESPKRSPRAPRRKPKPDLTHNA